MPIIKVSRLVSCYQSFCFHPADSAQLRSMKKQPAEAKLKTKVGLLCCQRRCIQKVIGTARLRTTAEWSVQQQSRGDTMIE